MARGLVGWFRRNRRRPLRWPDGRTRKDTKARFAGHERRGEAFDHGRLGTVSCPPEAAFVPFRVSPAGRPEGRATPPLRLCVRWLGVGSRRGAESQREHFRIRRRPFRWPGGRTRKDTKARFAGHERRGGAFNHGRHGTVSCPPKAVFVPFRVSPAGEGENFGAFQCPPKAVSVCSVAKTNGAWVRLAGGGGFVETALPSPETPPVGMGRPVCAKRGWPAER